MNRFATYLKQKDLLIPLYYWSVFLIIYILLFQLFPGKFYSLASYLTQWDGEHYLSIARDGYQMYPCTQNISFTCGNIGWFPFYPLVGKVISYTGLNHQYSLILVSWLSLLGAMIILYRLVILKFDKQIAIASLLSLIFFPVSFYFMAIFPYAFFLLIVTSIFYCIEIKKLIWVIPLTGILAVTYPSGSIIGFVLLYQLIKEWKNYNLSEKLSLISAMIAIGVAIMIYFSYYWYKFDNFFQYLDFQSQPYYAHRMRFPLITIYEALSHLRIIQAVPISIIFATVSVLIFYSRKIPASWQIYMFGILLFTPTMGTCACYYRHILVAFPLFAMIGLSYRSPKRKYLFLLYLIVGASLMWLVFLDRFKTGLLM
ncbi:MAG: hypothetical protein DRP35_08560 [Candidatus Zixiibacteriota bacterium]|nr:MAG: hypothetical protein DRP35_08560 [candidate division Zixibacteria bacterium]